MPGELSYAAAVVDVPAADRRVRRAGEDEIADADESVNAFFVSGEDGQADARCHVPLAHRSVNASTDDEDLLYDDTGDVVGVASQDADTVTSRSFGCPQPDGVVVGPGGQNRAIFAHGHTVDSSRMLAQYVKVISSSDLE